ncbi:MAG: hypothetical protein ACKVQV_03670 [Bacteroidia bacterium]
MKAENNKKIFLILLLILIVSSCASEMETIEQITLTLISNTKTPTVLTTNTLSPTPESDTLIQVEKSCMNLENLPADLELTGAWVRQDSSPFLENLEENLKYRIPLDGGGFLNVYQRDWSISPNGEWLAYLDTIIATSPTRIARTEGYSLRVIHSSGHSLSMEYWPITYQSIQGWVDDQNLLLNLNGRDIVLNPFSGKWHEVQTPIWLLEMNLKDSWVKYSPNLNQIMLYLDNYVELRDVDSGEIIFEGSTSYFGFRESLWSPNGTMLALATDRGNKIHIFRKDEEILSIDNSSYDILLSGQSGNVNISNMEWSLNNQRLIIETSDDVVILDVNERKIYDTCFFDEKLEKAWRAKSFFYSEDGRYIVTSLDVLKDIFYTVETFDVLVDLTNMQAYKLDTPKYKGRIGWLKLP